jgi:hypothetical protein
LALAGCAVAAYLALYQYGVVAQVWEPFFGQGSITVLNSGFLRPLSGLLGFAVHDAVLGALAYFFEAGLAVLGNLRQIGTRPWFRVVYAGFVVLMGLVSLGLIIVQGTVLHAWCTLCLASAAVSEMIIVVSFGEILVAGSFLFGRFRGRSMPRPNPGSH